MRDIPFPETFLKDLAGKERQTALKEIIKSGWEQHPARSYEYALLLLEEDLKTSEELYDAFYLAGASSLSLKSYAQAAGYYQAAEETAREMNKHNLLANALSGYGMACYYLGDYQHAVESYVNVHALLKGESNTSLLADCLHNLALSHKKLNNHLLALNFFKELNVIDAFAERVSLYVNMADCYLALGEFSNALLFSQKAINKAKETGQIKELSKAYFSHCLLLSKLNKEELALEELQTYGECFPAHAEFHEQAALLRGELLLKLGRAEEALAVLMPENEAKQEERLFLLAAAYQQKKDYQAALEFYKKAMEQKLCGERILAQEMLRQHRQKYEAEKRITQKRLEQITNYDLKAANENLKEANAAKDKFFTIIAHDLKNPLNSILMTSDYLTENYDDFSSEKIKKYVFHIQDAAQKMYSLIKNLLQWARSQTGQIQFKPETVDLPEFISSVIELLLPEVQKKKITLLAEEIPPLKIIADKNMLHTILRNLLANAVKFTPSYGKIWVACEDTSDETIIAVHDNGVGIADEHKKKLFKLEETYTTQGTNNEQGTGLGLILCKEFVEKHKGKIWLESTVGAGSCFYFSIRKEEKCE